MTRTGSRAAALLLTGLIAACSETPDIGPTAEQVADTSIATRAVDTATFQWRRVETPRATLYIAPSLPLQSTEHLADSVEVVISSHLEWLGANAIEPKVRLFFVSSRDEIEPITGSRAPGWSEPGSVSSYFVLNDSTRMGLRHEIMHALSWRIWGAPAAFWLSEAVATGSVPECGGLPTATVVAMLDQAGMSIPLETLRTRFTFAGDTGFVFYLQSAGLAQFIEKTYGRDKLRAVWSNGGLAKVRETLGADLVTLERDWRATVAATPAPAWPGWPTWRAQLNRLGCS